MCPAITLESAEWYVLCNWLRARENRLMYALRPRSAEWEFVHDLRRRIQATGEVDPPTAGVRRSVEISASELDYLLDRLRRRARRLRLIPWRERERREAVLLRRQLAAQRPE